MTCEAGSPRAKRSSASTRSAGQEYEPGRATTAGPLLTRDRWAVSARCRAEPRHPAALHAPPTLATKSRPARLVRNSAERCIAQSQTDTPNPSSSRARFPSPRPMQIRHGGRLPIPRAL